MEIELINNNIPFNKPEPDHWNNKFNYKLDNFQKYAFEAIDENKNVLITAHTGSGKTTIAEYAILKHVNSGNRIIYTTPIKALSNQVYKNLSLKYSFDIGIKTGDIDINSEAQIVIMTTEILRNNLFINIKCDDNKICCVIFDEVHYIKDADRGHIWEQALISLDKNIQLILLSATLADPINFGNWLYKVRERPIRLITTNHRIIPLTHYIYNGTMLIEVMNNNGGINKNLEIRNDKCKIDELIKLLIKTNNIPVLFFCFNRRKCEELARTIDFDMAENAAENNKYFYFLLSKYKYMTEDGLEQTKQVHSLIIRGIAFHHSGLHPILKEIIETMYNKNMIKILFATETFAVGINMPTKTVVFTELSKYTNGGYRLLLKEEYLQMAGRAGRRGIDKIGTVINIINGRNEYGDLLNILNNDISKTGSQFKLDINYVLKTTNIGIDPYLYYKNSIQYEEHMSRVLYITDELDIINNKIDNFEIDININKYNEIISYMELTGNKRKKYDLMLRRLEKDEIANFNKLYTEYLEYTLLFDKRLKLENELNNEKEYDINIIENIKDYLIKMDYIGASGASGESGESGTSGESGESGEKGIELTTFGKYAVQINEYCPIIICEIINQELIDPTMNFEQIISILTFIIDNGSIISPDEELIITNSDILKVSNTLTKINILIDENPILNLEPIEKTELELYIYYLWAQGIEYRNITKYISYVGDFEKGILKICAMCEKLCIIYEQCNLELYNILKDYKVKLIRSIITLDSLYIQKWMV